MKLQKLISVKQEIKGCGGCVTGSTKTKDTIPS